MHEVFGENCLSKDETQELLDRRLEEAIAAYSIICKLEDRDPDGEIPSENLQLSDDLLMEIILFSDAKAHIDASPDQQPDRAAWAAAADNGIKLAAKSNKSLVLVPGQRPFAPEQFKQQSVLYGVMHARRGAVKGPVLNRWVGEEYARRVAIGQIAIMPETDFGE